jgi:hypothetical protein
MTNVKYYHNSGEAEQKLPENRMAVIGIVPVIVIAVVLGAYLNLTLSSPSVNSTINMATGSLVSVSIVNSTLGLRLILSINSSVIPSEEAINVTFQLENTFTTTNNLTAEVRWAIPAYSGPCDFGNGTSNLEAPIGIAIYKGDYGLNNISGAPSLRIWAEIGCIADLAFNSTGGVVGPWTNITSYSILPGTDNGTQTGYAFSQQNQEEAEITVPAELDFNTQIYANNGTGFQPYNSLNSSLPGNYTVAAADEWGQLVLLHFQVIASHDLPEVGEFLSASSSYGGCTASGYPVPCIVTDFSDATIFNCASAAQTGAGCQFEGSSSVSQPPTNYTIDVFYSKLNQTGEPSWANCLFTEKGEPVTFGYCYNTNSTAFVFTDLTVESGGS